MSRTRHSRLTQLAVGVFILMLITYLAWWLRHHYKPIKYTARTEMSAEARRNPLLAAERLLNRLGHRAESQSGRQYLVRPPAEPGVLLVRDLGAPLSREQADELLAWVAAGGHLIAGPGRFWDEDQSRPLLEYFGVEFTRVGAFDDIDWPAAEQDESDAESEAEADETIPIRLPEDAGEPLDIAFDPDAWFDVDNPNEYWWAPDEGDTHMLRFALEKGYVTLLSDCRFFDNRHIGDFDHAPLLAELTAGYDRVWLLYSARMPSLLQLLWNRAPYLLVSLGLLSLLLLWRMGRRSGPLILTTRDQRRDLLEHLQAAADFNWRLDPAAGLLPQVRQQVEKSWLLSHPKLQRLDTAGRCAWLAERTGLNVEAIHLALYKKIPEDGGQLVKTAANLQRLLAALRPQGKKR